MSIELRQPTSSADEFRILGQLATNTVLALGALLRGRSDSKLLRDARRLFVILRQAKPAKVKGLKRFEARLVERASTALSGPSAELQPLADILGPTDQLVARVTEGHALTPEEFALAERAQSLFNRLSVHFSRSAVAEHRALKSERSLSKCA
jgi:hypothetical protein